MTDINTSQKQIFEAFRISVRVEGAFLNAYIAPPTTLVDALLLATVRLDYLDGPDGQLTQQFHDLCKALISKRVKQALGVQVADYVTKPMPPNEKPGNC